MTLKISWLHPGEIANSRFHRSSITNSFGDNIVIQGPCLYLLWSADIFSGIYRHAVFDGTVDETLRDVCLKLEKHH